MDSSSAGSGRRQGEDSGSVLGDRHARGSDQPGCRDIVRHQHNGLLVPARDVGALAAALERLLKEPALRQQMGARGRALVEAEFSLDIVIRQTLEIYRELRA